MELLLRLIKIALLVALILVLAVLFAPTLKGPFVIIHFSTALRAWIFAQLAFLGLCLAAAVMIVLTVSKMPHLEPLFRKTIDSAFPLHALPLRC